MSRNTQVRNFGDIEFVQAGEGWVPPEEVDHIEVGNPEGDVVVLKPGSCPRPFDPDRLRLPSLTWDPDEITVVDTVPRNFEETVRSTELVGSFTSNSKEETAPLPPPPPVGNQPVVPLQTSGAQDVVNEEVWFTSAPVEDIAPPSLVTAPRPNNAGLFMLAGMLAALLIGVLCMGVVAWKRGAIGQTKVVSTTQSAVSVVTPVEFPAQSVLVMESPEPPPAPLQVEKFRKKVRHPCRHHHSCPCKKPGGRHFKRVLYGKTV